MRNCPESPQGSMAIVGGQRRAHTEGNKEVKDHPAPHHQRFHCAYHKDGTNTTCPSVNCGFEKFKEFDE